MSRKKATRGPVPAFLAQTATQVREGLDEMVSHQKQVHGVPWVGVVVVLVAEHQGGITAYPSAVHVRGCGVTQRQFLEAASEAAEGLVGEAKGDIEG